MPSLDEFLREGGKGNSASLPSLDVFLNQNNSQSQSPALKTEIPAGKELPFFAKAQKYVYDHTLGPATNLLYRGATSATNMLTGGALKRHAEEINTPFLEPFKDAMKPASNGLEKAADIAGAIYGLGGGVESAYATGGRLAQLGITKFAPQAPKIVQAFTRGVGAGLPFASTQNAIGQGLGDDKSAGELTKDIALETALFGAGDAAFSGLGTLLSKGKKVAGDAVKPNTIDEIDAAGIQDYSGFKYNTTDLYRNFKDAYGDNFPIVKEAILDPFDASKGSFVDMQKQWSDKLKTEVVDKLGIHKGSKLSKLVQDYGEGTITLDKLKEATPKDWEKVIEADKFFRKSYDELIDTVNKTRESIYPGNPEKLVPKRSNYYRHFREFEGLAGLKNIFDTPSQISPGLEGTSEFTLPKSKFAGFMQRRGMGPYKSDAVGGFLDYIKGASYSTHIDPQIDVFKGLAKDIAVKTEESKNANNFVNYLQKFSQDLAGKTNGMDRYFQENIPGGRTTMAALNWLNSRYKTNAVLGNVSSALAQLANVPNGIAYAKKHAVDGAMDTIKSIVKPLEQVQQSVFLKERFSERMYRQFDTKLIQQPKRFAEWAMETADRIGTEFTWNSAYRKAIADGAANPIKAADDATRGLIAGRGVGEVPLMQKSKLFQLIAPFQLEVANLWKVQKDFVNEKDFSGLMTLYLANFMLNQGMEEVRGSRVTFDPIKAVVDASAEGLTTSQRIGRVGGEIIGNIPLGGSLAKTVISNPATRKEFFGSNDPTRFGTGAPLAKTVSSVLTDPTSAALSILPAFGGNQIKKTLNGTRGLINGGDYSKDKLKFPLDRNAPTGAKSLLFGPAATSQGQLYYDNDRSPLGTDQTLQYQGSPQKQEFYNEIMKQRELERIRNEIDDVSKNEEISEMKKELMIAHLKKQYQNIWDGN